MLLAARRKIEASPSASHPLSSTLTNEFAALESKYDSVQTYRSVGSKMSKMSSLSHHQQRATHLNASAYSAGSKRKASLKMAWKSSLNNEPDDMCEDMCDSD